MPTSETEYSMQWLESLETDWENAELCGYTGKGTALCFFRDDFEFNDLFNTVIVEGTHPGSVYRAAVHQMDVGEANQLAIEQGIPVWFDWSGE
jgi:hypothetical protein